MRATPKTIMVKVAPLTDMALAGKAMVRKQGTMARYHLESDGVFEVPLTAHYLRKLHFGELIRVEKPPKPATPKPITSEE